MNQFKPICNSDRDMPTSSRHIFKSNTDEYQTNRQLVMNNDADDEVIVEEKRNKRSRYKDGSSNLIHSQESEESSFQKRMRYSVGNEDHDPMPKPRRYNNMTVSN